MRKLINIIVGLGIAAVTLPVALVTIIIVGFLVLNCTGNITKIGKSFMNRHIEGRIDFESLHFELENFPIITVEARNGFLISHLEQNRGDTLASFRHLRASINPFMIFTDNLVFIPNVFLDSPKARVQMSEDKRPGWAVWRFKKASDKKTVRKKSKTELNIRYVTVIGPAFFEYHNNHNKVRMKASGDSLHFEGRIAIDYKKIFPDNFCVTNLHYEIINENSGLRLNTNADSINIDRLNNSPFKEMRVFVSSSNDSIRIKRLNINYPLNIVINGTVTVSSFFRCFEINNFKVVMPDTRFLLNGIVTKIRKDIPYETDIDFINIGTNPLGLIKVFFPDKMFLDKTESYLPYSMNLNVKGKASQSLNLLPMIKFRTKIKNGIFKYDNYPYVSNIEALLNADFPDENTSKGTIRTNMKMNLINSEFKADSKIEINKGEMLVSANLSSFLDLSNFNPFISKYRLAAEGKTFFDLKIEKLLFRESDNKISANLFRTGIKVDSINLTFGNNIVSLSKGIINFQRTCDGETDIRLNADSMNVDIGSLKAKTKGVKNNIRFNLPDSLTAFLFKTHPHNYHIVIDDKEMLKNTFGIKLSSAIEEFALYEKKSVLKLENQNSDISLNIALGKRNYLRWLDMSTESKDFHFMRTGLEITAKTFGITFNSKFLNMDTIPKSRSFIVDQLLFNDLLKPEIVLNDGYIKNGRFFFKTLFDSLSLSMNKDYLKIDYLKAKIGDSDILLNGYVDNINTFFNDSMRTRSELNVRSSFLNLNQVITDIAKYNLRKRYNDSVSNELAGKIFPPKFYRDKSENEADNKPILPLLPSNLSLRLNLDAQNIVYANDTLKQSKGSFYIIDRALIIDDFNVYTDFGYARLFAYYRELNDKKAETSAALSLNNLNVERAVNLFPDLGKIAKPIASVRGDISAKIIAKGNVDSLMRIAPESVNAISIINSDTLSITKAKILPKLLGEVLFYRQKRISLCNLTIDAALKDNVLSVYPFIADFKRYKFLFNGVMDDVDNRFFYHVGIMKSILPFKVGMDIYGKHNSKIHFRLAPVGKVNIDFPSKYMNVSPLILYPYPDIKNEYYIQYLYLMSAYRKIINSSFRD